MVEAAAYDSEEDMRSRSVRRRRRRQSREWPRWWWWCVCEGSLSSKPNSNTTYAAPHRYSRAASPLA